MDPASEKFSGWLDSLRRTGDALLGLAQNRFELFATECREEKLRALNLLIWLGAALVLGAAGLLTGLAALALFLWSLAGYAGLIGLMLVLLATAAGVVWNIRRRIRNGPAPFADTVAEFRKDRACLRRED